MFKINKNNKNFAKNPKNGGIPAKDKKTIKIVIEKKLYKFKCFKLIRLVSFVKFKKKNNKKMIFKTNR